ncbi:acetate/propionate family kinase [Gandjariella thermophila]|uniref:acetate/propionate family kinase n=1 Tax=Gandjariella thermophila TaxID=1931992 RepID=UPI0010F4AEF8|nr:acetate kinase [Gandjariella thermophila]
MRVLTANPGSSSLKLALVASGRRLDERVLSGWDGALHHGLLAELGARWAPLDAIGVRFVHGGDRAHAVRLTDAELADLDRLVPLAPLHQPRSLALARRARAALPGLPTVGCFDTSFHAGLPERARRYALPAEWVRTYRLRRYGFHGLSCAHAVRRTAELLAAEPGTLRMLCCHMGAGVSVTAVDGGRSVDTSMGFTPLEGAVMATRSGTVDPGLLVRLLDLGAADPAELGRALEHRSGLAGMTGTGGDVRDVLAARASGDREARVAIEVYLHRLRRELAAATVSLDRLDAVAFTGGVAEHQPDLLAELADGLAPLGVRVDAARLHRPGDRVISPDRDGVRVLALTAQEDLEIARQAELVLGRRSHRSPALHRPAVGGPP